MLLQQTAVKLFDEIEYEAKVKNKPSLYHPYKYLNYADGGQDVIKGYGKESVRRLRSVSRRVDPRGVFQRQVVGGYKLWRGREGEEGEEGVSEE